MSISRYAVKHPVVVSMLLIALVVFGIYCLTGINVEFISDMSLPSIEVLTVYPGALAEDVERDVTKILEDDFVTLPNFKSMSSTNQNSLSWITIRYDDSVDPYDQLDELRYRIDMLVDQLPDNIQGKPIALVGGATMLPVFEFSVSGGGDIGRITKYIEDEVIPRLTRINGVSDITVMGGQSLEAQVKLRLDDLQSKGISVMSVYQLLNHSNAYIPLGESTYNGKSVVFNYNGKLDSLEEIGNLTVGMGADNVIVKLRDVADISYAYPEGSAKAFSDGRQLIIVQISKRLSGNTMQITQQARQVLEEIELETNGALQCRVLSDDSRSITTSLKNVISSGVVGVIMAIIVIFLFLNDARATLAIGLSIPLSVLFTFLGMKVLGKSINLISVSGIVVALGMIVDGSIVMLEQVFRNFSSRAISTIDAINKGSDEVGGSIIASGLTTIVVFIPMIFLKGLVGMITEDFSVTLLICLAASMVVAVVVVPYLMRVFYGNKPLKERRKSLFLRMHDATERGYRRSLAWGLHERKFIMLIPIILLALSLLLIPMLGYSFMPAVDTGDFYAYYEFPYGYMPEQMEERLNEMEQIIRREVPELETVVSFSSQSGFLGGDIGSDSSRHGYAHIVLNSSDARERSVHKIILDLQKVLSEEIPDCDISVSNGGFDKLLAWITEGGGFQVSLVGSDIRALYQEALKIEGVLKDCPSVVSTSIDTDFNAVSVSLDMSQDYLNSLGITSYEAGVVSRILFSGIEAGRISGADGQRYPIKLTSDASDEKLSEDLLSKLVIKSAAGDFISFAGLSDFKVEQSISAIKRYDRLRSVSVSAHLISDDASEANSVVNAYLADHPLSDGIGTRQAGVMKLILDSLGQMVTVLAIAVFLVYAVMVIQFERFQQPFIIMLSVPFAIIGVIAGLLIFGSSMSIMSVIAVISLAGVVVNNAIIMIDYMNLLRDRRRAARLHGVDESLVDSPGCAVTHEEGRGLLLSLDDEMRILADSVADGASSRLRPIMMTTLTTLFGVFPMALGIGEGAELYAPVGQAIFGGLLASTLVSLFLVPIAYYAFERKSILRKTEFAGRKS